MPTVATRPAPCASVDLHNPRKSVPAQIGHRAAAARPKIQENLEARVGHGHC